MSLAEKVLAGDLRAAARLMRMADDGEPGWQEEIAAIYPSTGKAPFIGITGSPGTGKSTLIDCLIEYYRARGLSVGVVAVDPSSPFSGGAILADRLRMQRHAVDPGVFIRSVATRGAMGGLSRSTAAIARVLEAAGMEVVLIETVGVGQDEVDIMKVASTVVVILAPGLGDEVQSLKAGLLEIADVLVVNKSDRDGADSVVHYLEQLLQMKEKAPGEWIPMIVKTAAVKSEGMDGLLAAVEKHRGFITGSVSGERRRRERAREELLSAVSALVVEQVLRRIENDGRLDGAIDEVFNCRTDPLSAAKKIIG